MGALTGATATLGGGFAGEMIMGTVSGMGNEFADHIIRQDPCNRLDGSKLKEDLIDDSLRGMAGGFFGGVWTKIGKVFYLPGMRNLSSDSAGAITGTAADIAASISLN